MANISVNPDLRSPAFGQIRRVFTAIGHGIVAIGEANSRVKQAQALHALTDAQLAERGLKREDIGRHVFGDRFYI